MSAPLLVADPLTHRTSESPTLRSSNSRSSVSPLTIAGLLAVVVGVAWCNSFHVPFLMDDDRTIVTNESLRHFSSLADLFKAPANSGVSGRPLLNLTFLLNYAWGGDAVVGYHVVNLLVHVAATLTLFGLVRRTLRLPRLQARFASSADFLAGAIALLWAIHPVQTETVTYISQRAEALMGLFYLLTLYAFVRAVTAPRAAAWLGVSVACAWLGMATKQVMVTAPFMVLVFDGIFVTRGLVEAWRARRGYYVALAASWILLAILMASATRSVGFQQGVSSWVYLLTECGALVRYLGTSGWPGVLVFDYGPQFTREVADAFLSGLIVLAVIGAVVWAIRRAPKLGFAGLWFFVVLAPTSSVVPIVLQPVAESRLYLPLAGVVTIWVVALHTWLGRAARWVVLMLAAAATVLTIARNAVYGSDLVLWRDTVAKVPNNARAHDNLGNAFTTAGKYDEAIAQYRLALSLAPDNNARIHYNLGRALFAQGHLDGAVHEYQETLRLEPSYAPARENLATALAKSGRTAQAEQILETMQQAAPADAKVKYNLGLTHFRNGEFETALAEFEEVLRLEPGFGECRDALATTLLRLGRRDEAMAQYEQTLREHPEFAVGHDDYGLALLTLGRLPEARAQFEQALALNHDLAPAHSNLGVVLARMGDRAGAQSHYETALRLDPTAEETEYRLGNLLAQSGRISEAAGHWEKAVALNPNDAEAHNNLGLACAQLGRLSAAIEHFKAVVRLRPDFTEARENLATLQSRQSGGAGN